MVGGGERFIAEWRDGEVHKVCVVCSETGRVPAKAKEQAIEAVKLEMAKCKHQSYQS